MKSLVIEGKEIIIENLYSFRYDYGKGKEVLRIEILESNHRFEELKVLANENNKNIMYLEDNVKKNEYTGYCKDFSCSYQEGKYSVEITRLSESDHKIEQIQKVIDYIIMQ